MKYNKPLLKRIIAAIAALTCTSACFSACGLYGPPQPDESEATSKISFSPETNVSECVYGPPEYFTDSE